MVKKKEADGNMTLEMTLLIPFILGVILLVMFLLFYHHNKGVLLDHAYEVALLASKDQKSEKQDNENHKKSDVRLVMGDLINLNINEIQNKIVVSYHGRMNLPKGGMFFLIPNKWYELSGEVTVELNKEVEFIHRYKKIKELVKED